MAESTNRRAAIGRFAIAAAMLSMIVITVAACTSGDGEPSGASSTPADATSPSSATSTVTSGTTEGLADLESSLRVLGVDTTPTDRVAADQEALPENYSPLGSSPAYGDPAEGSNESGQNKTDELLVVGLQISGTGTNVALAEQLGVQIDAEGVIDPGSTSILHTVDDSDPAWMSNPDAGNAQSDDTRRLRSLAAGDIDGDGLEEVVVVYVDTSAADRILKIRIIDDAENGFSEVEDVLGEGDSITDVAVVTGDFNGDGSAQIAVSVGVADGAELRLVAEDAGDYRFETAALAVYETSFPEGAIVTVELVSENLDYDNPYELGVVVNEFAVPDGLNPQGASTFYVYDDGNTGFAELERGPVQGRDGAVFVAVVADIDFGDVDGDGLAEVVLGGLAEFNTSCAPYDAFITVRDDAVNDMSEMDSDSFNAFFSNCPAFNPWRLRFLHVGALDLDGDGVDELHANGRIYGSLIETGDLTLIHELPQEVFVDRDSDAGARISSATTAMSTADITGDGRENLIVYVQWQDDVGVWGLSPVASVDFAELTSIEVDSFSNVQRRTEPELLAVNVDADSPLLKYSDGEYALAFTEPVVIAAMAAAPCGEGIGQNLTACATSFGQGESTTVDAELTVTVKAGTHVGVESEAKIPIFGGVSTSLKQSITVTASQSAGTAYTVEKSRTFTTGPLEDGVVFTTIPYDRYTYQIVSHPDPTLVGGTIVVSLPREPIILKVERRFFNSNIVESSVAIDDRIFEHVIGDIESYPTVSRKNGLTQQFGGLENGPISVGEGTGTSGLEIAVSTEVSEGGSLGIEYEQDVEVTAGPAMAGYTVGYGTDASLTFISGSQTTYTVAVGDLASDTFAANQYSYGIFTYVQAVGDQKFEVINFWVE